MYTVFDRYKHALRLWTVLNIFLTRSHVRYKDCRSYILFLHLIFSGTFYWKDDRSEYRVVGMTKKLGLTQLFCLSNKIYLLNWKRELVNSFHCCWSTALYSVFSSMAVLLWQVKFEMF